MDINFVVIIPTYGRSILLERTLESLAQCNLPKGLLKIIIVENGPKGNAEAVSEKFRSKIKTEYLYSEKANKSLALNEALKLLDDETFIVFFDDDIRISPQLLDAYSVAFSIYKEDYFYGGPVDVDYEKEPSKYYALHLPLSARGWVHKSGTTLLPNHLLGCNWAVSKKNLQKVGFFNHEFGPNSSTGATGQEHEMMVRLNDAGVRPLYVPDALVWHYVPTSRSSLRWALIRKYKMGVSYGLSKKQLPYKDLSSEISKSMFSLAKAVIKLSRTQAVQRLFNLYFLLGVRKGLKIK